MTLKELPIGKSATLTVVGGEGALRTAFSGYGTYSGGRRYYGKIRTNG